MEYRHDPSAGARRTLRTALGEAEDVGDVLCFLELAMQAEDLPLAHYPRRGLARLLGDCSRRVDRVCRLLDRILSA